MRFTGEPIAIVGVGCVLPDAFDPESFARNVESGRSAIRTLTGGRWSWADYLEPRYGLDATHSILGARIEGYSFDWKRFRIPPADAELVNPMQLRTLDAGVQALSGVKELPRETTGVILGATGLGWQPDSAIRIRMREMLDALEASEGFRALDAERRAAVLASVKKRVDARFGVVSEDNVVNASASVAAGRIHMHFDLTGPHFAVDAGFASSLAAVDVGARMLRDRTLDCVLVGGASEILTPLEVLAFAKLGGLARGDVRPFDARADGTLLGEGVVVFAMKRLDDALRDREDVVAVLRGIGGASDGRGRSIVAPNPDGQALAMRRALADAGVDPRTIGFVECHATGTEVGDASEIAAMARVYGGTEHDVILGSAKPFVGHLRGASGAVGMLRAIQALRAGAVRAQLGFERPIEALERDDARFLVPRIAMPLAPVGGADVRRAAVSSFGFGGNSYHAILEEWRPGSSVTKVRHEPVRNDEPIAIVGMGGVFPGGASVDAFFESLLAGNDATREVPKDRWDVDRYFDADRSRNETCYTKLGCFLDALPTADARWRIPPASLATVDPGQLLVLRATEQALADARLAEDALDADRVAVHLAFLPYQGKKFLADIRVNVREVAREMEAALVEQGQGVGAARAVVAGAVRSFVASLPTLTEDTMPGYLGSINAARVTRLYDLHGPHFVVDSACASSHASLFSSAQALRHGLCDVAISGGVWVDMKPEFFVAACRFQALSATGSTPFSSEADGFVPGEGGGVVVLMRLSDAIAKGRPIRAVLRSVAGSSDGKGRSVLAPKPEGETSAMLRAIAAAGVGPDDVDYVECHGTGTALGDVVEVDAVTRTYGRARTRPMLIGSVKSNVGHLNAAAGIVGLIKTVCALERGVIPASLKAESPNPAIDFARGPIEVVTRQRAWPEPETPRPRRAAVSGFGVGGTNMHLVVEQHRPDLLRRSVHPSSIPSRRGETAAVVPIAVACAPGLEACVASLRAFTRLDDAAYLDAVVAAQALVVGREGIRVAIVARSAEELGRRLDWLERVASPLADGRILAGQGIFVGLARPRGRVALVFPGQGPQYPNMARDVIAAFPDVRATIDEADRIYRRIAGRALSPAFLVDPTIEYEQRDEDIHCAVFVVACAMARFLVDRGLRFDVVLGQSAGELAALVVAGVLSFEDGLIAMRARTLAVLDVRTDDPGRMIALPCGAERALELIEGLPGFAALAADNSPSASIVSLDRKARARLEGRLSAAGVEGTVLSVSHGYHSQLIGDARPAYRAALQRLRFGPPQKTIVSTVSGEKVVDARPGALVDALVQQYVTPVRLRGAVETAYAEGVRTFFECGPKWPLSTFVGEILAGRDHVAQATLHPKIGEVEQAWRALACAFASRALDSFEPEIGSVRESGPYETRNDQGAEMSARRIPDEDAGARSAARDPRDAAPRDDAFRSELLGLLRGIASAIDDFASRWEGETRDSAEWARVASSPPQTSPRPSTVPPRSIRPPSARVPSMQTAARPAEPSPVPSIDDVRRIFVEKLAARTGYPQDMLEDELDLEADLGIDTVKQIAVMGETREHFGLPVDPGFKLRHFSTIAAFSAYLARRIGGERATTSRPSSRAPRSVRVQPAAISYAAVRLVFVEKLTARTGYPQDMLEDDLDLEADLGIDTVKQIAVMGETRERFGLPIDPKFKLRHHPTIRAFCTYLLERLGNQGGPGEGPSGRGSSRSSVAPSNGGSSAGAARVPLRPSDAPPSLAIGRWVEAIVSLRGAVAGLELCDLRLGEVIPMDGDAGYANVASDGRLRISTASCSVAGQVRTLESAPLRERRSPDWLPELRSGADGWSSIVASDDLGVASVRAAAAVFDTVRAPRFDELLASGAMPAGIAPAAAIGRLHQAALAASRLLHLACAGEQAEPTRMESFLVESLPVAGARYCVRASLRGVDRHAVEIVAEDGTRLASAEGILVSSSHGDGISRVSVLERRAWLRLRRALSAADGAEVSTP